MDPGIDFLTTVHNLYDSSLQGNWVEALATYRSSEASIHNAAINRSGDTALHVAVNIGTADIVKKMVDELRRSGSLSALGIGNERGETPLHCAAWRGSREMCECIAEAHGGDYRLIEDRNDNQETPLYLAALQGNKEAFLYLRSRCLDKSVGPCRRGGDGDTVLHCTIRREHFELAYEIIYLYGDEIVGSVDEKGITPLHILASKPSAFYSSINLRRWITKLAYSCIIVEKLRITEQGSNNNTFKNGSNSAETQTGRQTTKKETDPENPREEGDGNENVTPNYWTSHILRRAFTCFMWPVFGVFAAPAISFMWLVFGAFESEDIRKKKEKIVWCGQILDAILSHKNTAYSERGSAPQDNYDLLEFGLPKTGGEEKENSGEGRREPVLLIAAKNGVAEIVEKILRDKPGAIYQTNSQGRNVLHVAVENRQPHIFGILQKARSWDILIHSGDSDGNNTLHIVAKSKSQIQGSSALEMQDEIKWYEYVKSLLPSYLTVLTNQGGETPEETFFRDHKELVQKSDEWLSRTSESCSVVAALVAGVAYATSTSVPGGNDDKTGKPTLEGRHGFDIFAISALIALCFSVTALIMFLSILTSRKHPADFMRKLPVKLLLALSSLFVSIFSMFISFCAAHSFVLQDMSKKSVIPLYAIISLPVSFTIVQFPLYMDLFEVFLGEFHAHTIGEVFSGDNGSAGSENKTL